MTTPPDDLLAAAETWAERLRDEYEAAEAEDREGYLHAYDDWRTLTSLIARVRELTQEAACYRRASSYWWVEYYAAKGMRAPGPTSSDPEQDREIREMIDHRARIAELERQHAIDIEAARTLHPTANSVGDAAVVVGAKVREQSAELERLKHPVDSYACQRCGRADGMDAVVPNDVWRIITEGEWANPDPETRRGEVANGKWNLLCLWCIDELCAEHDIQCSASLHFAGRAVHGTSDSDANADHVSRLVADIAELTAENEHLRRFTKGL